MKQSTKHRKSENIKVYARNYERDHNVSLIEVPKAAGYYIDPSNGNVISFKKSPKGAALTWVQHDHTANRYVTMSLGTKGEAKVMSQRHVNSMIGNRAPAKLTDVEVEKKIPVVVSNKEIVDIADYVVFNKHSKELFRFMNNTTLEKVKEFVKHELQTGAVSLSYARVMGTGTSKIEVVFE